MKKNGFTLVEILAVFAILAILASLITPKIKEIFKDSKESIYLESTKNLISSLNEYYIKKNIAGTFQPCTYDYSGVTDCNGYSFDGAKPSKGNIKINEIGQINGLIKYDNYIFLINDGTVTKFNPNEISGKEYTYDFIDETQTFIAEYTGYYKLEVWGAQGGSLTDYEGGYGGYSYGEIYLDKDKKIYITVGEQGKASTSTTNGYVKGGYNGGADAYTIASSCNNQAGSGGGATHIATQPGELSSLKSGEKILKETVIIVAGGGGGSLNRFCRSSDVSYAKGGAGGGATGGSPTDVRVSWPYKIPTGGTQLNGGIGGTVNNESGTASGTFGKSTASTRTGGTSNSAGGGGGYFGGGTGMFTAGAGGSGYIGNENLSNKGMYCYGCEENKNPLEITHPTQASSKTPTANTAKEGNGYAKITYIGFE